MDPKQHKYQAVGQNQLRLQQEHQQQPNQQHHDDEEAARSSTEVDESLLGDDADEKHWLRKQLRGRTPPSRASRLAGAALGSWRWLVDTALLLVVVGLLLRDRARKAPRSPWQIGADFTGVGPEFSPRITRFVMDQSYAPQNSSEFFTNPDVLEKWNKLMPVGMGFVWVNHTETYHDLPKPVDWDEGMTVFTTSMTHQLHCLFAIVQTYSGLKSGHPIPDDHHWHMTHCFDYMRQAIMCSADIALEGHETTFPDHNGGSDGWDSTHVCKDYGQVVNYLESVRAYDDQQIY